MIDTLLRAAGRLPFINRILEERQIYLHKENEELAERLAARQTELNRAQEHVLQMFTERALTNQPVAAIEPDSADVEPWRHPFLNARDLSRFRDYSDGVWQFATEYARQHPEPLRAAFTVNMCQNMYKWARMSQERGFRSVLFPHVMDTTALSRPEWEEFDGEHEAVFDGESFLRAHPDLRPQVPCEYVPIATEGSELLGSWVGFGMGTPEEFVKLQAERPGVRHEALLSYGGFYTYYQWARRLAEHDVIYACSNPFAAYASGRPYMVASVGGDLIFDAGRRNAFGRAHLVAFNAARFQTISNPHTLGHCRRLGLTNPVYLPYPMDDRRYCPGPPRARGEWEQRFGKGVYVLAPSRIDSAWKGYDAELLGQLRALTRAYKQVRFVFLGWGENQADVRKWIDESGLSSQVIVLPPVGKKRLIDYYRSCDIVLDHFVYGYYGVTALEAAAIGRPVVMKLRTNHYDPLYRGDVAPVNNVTDAKELSPVLGGLIASESLRREQGDRMRQWLLRTHGEDRTMPLLLALLRVTADGVALPPDLKNPLADPLTDAEVAYHQSCLQVVPEPAAP